MFVQVIEGDIVRACDGMPLALEVAGSGLSIELHEELREEQILQKWEVRQITFNTSCCFIDSTICVTSARQPCISFMPPQEQIDKLEGSRSQARCYVDVITL